MSAKRYLVTGFSGFVSRHFLDLLEKQGEKAEVLGIDLQAPAFNYVSFKNIHCDFREINLLDSEKVREALRSFQPHYILHFASYSSVAYSWKNPTESFKNNTNIFLNVLDALRDLSLPCRILSIGSSEEYGNVAPTDLPLLEEHPLEPVSPYAVARVSQEMLSKIYARGYGLDIVLTRSFNHIGTHQKDFFVVSSFAKQLVNIKKQGGKGKLVTGDLSIVRDFIDIEDVVRAYHLLLEKGRSGEVYNICSGKGVALREIVDAICTILHIEVSLEVDPALLRPDDNRIIVGSHEKITREIRWEPQVSLQKSLENIVSYWHENTV